MNKFVLLYRSFSMGYVAHGKSYVKEARVMNRFIGAQSKRRSWYPAKDVSAASLPHIIQPKRGERDSRRMAVLNKLFMKYISDLMTTGELTPETTTMGIEISKVKISQDFSALKVYWVAKGTSTDENIENLLFSNAKKLRHELTQLRVIGNVPTIVFVKDKSLSKVAEVDAVLARADFGEDFVPTDPSFTLLSNLTLSTKLPKHLEEKILQEDIALLEIPVPSMQSDALGLDHDNIMQKIKSSMKKAKAPHRSQLLAQSSGEVEIVKEETLLPSLKSEEIEDGLETAINVPNADLKKFFAKRMALQSKIMRNPKNFEPSKELLMHEESSVNDDEDDDFDVLANDVQRVKDLEIQVDDFTELEEDYKSILYDGSKEK
ncbi:putative ribosome-binding factor A, mitochondrial [Ischnura elegans]|uniref:putative ribosome-binding factor A, mitochondrial n=1 Tax=Ischnura elegans TaxID=197161 RepID=UPI001ED876E6|nr:putative ribosome-binding factor A, mitochondrial [Ischnura elegans]